MMIYEDTRQQIHSDDKHAEKHRWWKLHGIDVVRKKIDFGDYVSADSNYAIDTKRSIDEVASNISREHARFKREILRARDAGYRLVILVENRENVLKLADLVGWTNGHCVHCRYRRECDPHDIKTACKRHGTKKPIQGEQLAKAMATMQAKYGVQFEFCHPELSARRICTLLGIQVDWLCCDCYMFASCPEAEETKLMCDRGCPF